VVHDIKPGDCRDTTVNRVSKPIIRKAKHRHARIHAVLFILLGALSLWQGTASAVTRYGDLWIAGEHDVLKIDAQTGAISLRFKKVGEVTAIAIDDTRARVWLAKEHKTLDAYDFSGNLLLSVSLRDLAMQIRQLYPQQKHASRRDPRRQHTDKDKKNTRDKKHRHDDDEDNGEREEKPRRGKAEHEERQQERDDDEELEIKTIRVDKRDGSVWLGAKNHLIKLSSDGHFISAIRLQHRIRALALDIYRDTLWVASKKHLLAIDMGSSKIRFKLELGKKVHIEALDFDQHLGQLWVGMKKRLLRVDRSGNTQLDLSSRQLKIKHLEAIASDGQGNLWIGDERHLRRYSRDGVLQLSVEGKKRWHEVKTMLSNVNDHSLWLLDHHRLFHVLADGESSVVLKKRRHKEEKAMAINGDLNAPHLRIVAPEKDALVPRRPQIKLSYHDMGVGADVSSVTLKVNDKDIAVSCKGDDAQAICEPDIELFDEILTLTLSIKDYALNLSDSVSVTVKLDSDGDGVPDERDTYPLDPTRWRLAAVTHIVPSLLGTKVKLAWDEHVDPPNTQGYVIYRQQAGQDTESKLSANPLTVLSYLDANVNNATGYRYRVVAVDKRGFEGEPGEAHPFFVAYNITPVNGFSVLREKADGRLVWSPVGKMRYEIFRGGPQGPTQSLTQLNETTYLDTGALWDQEYGYQIASIADFTDVFSGLALAVTGPKSSIQILPALPPLGLSINQAYADANGALQLTVLDPERMSISGNYSEAVGPVNVSVSGGGETLSAIRSDGRFNFIIPVQAASQWTFIVSEQTVANRSTTLTLDLIIDTEGPTLQLDGNASREVDSDTVTITGSATDSGSGVAEVYASSSRDEGQRFGGILGAGGHFSLELPLQSGDNAISVTARDRLNNLSSASLQVRRKVAQAPKISINHPHNGDSLYIEPLSLSGVVYTSLPAEQVRIKLSTSQGTQQQFPAQNASDGIYPFTFNNIHLREGYNTLGVRVETPAGNAEAHSTVLYSATPPTPEVTPPPLISLSAPVNHYLSAANTVVAGSVDSAVKIKSFSINGNPVTLVGALDSHKDFHYSVDLSGISDGPIELLLLATDSLDQSSQKNLTLYNDMVAPQLSLTTTGLQDAPASNHVLETPYPLQGEISDSHLAGFSINNKPIGLLPGSTPGTYRFDVALALEAKADQHINLEARDLAGNITRKELIFDVDVPVAIEFISPRADSTWLSNDSGAQIEVTARATGLGADDTLHLSLDTGSAQVMQRDGNAANATLQTSLNQGEYKLIIEAHDATGQVLARHSQGIVLKNLDAIPLTLIRSEPVNNSPQLTPGKTLSLYFNRAIDPSLLQVEVKETMHGRGYDLVNQQDIGLSQLPSPKLVDVHHDMLPVAGSISRYPGNRYVSFNPTRRFAYGADIYVTVSYDNAELSRLHFKVKPLPTYITGRVTDQRGAPIAGIKVALGELGLSGETNDKGNYSLRSEQASQKVRTGRYHLTINPGQHDPHFGVIEIWADIRQGELNTQASIPIPLLNKNIPYARLQSGQSQVVLARGNLVLDLSQAQLRFANGRGNGNVHVQFTPATELAYQATDAATPYWMYNLQPQGIAVEGEVGITLQMPKLFGSEAYIPAEGTRVVMLGLDPASNLLAPVGVGQVKNKQVHSEGVLHLQRLDYLGYALMDAASQDVLARYAAGEINTLGELVNALEKVAGQ